MRVKIIMERFDSERVCKGLEKQINNFLSKIEGKSTNIKIEYKIILPTVEERFKYAGMVAFISYEQQH